MTEQFAIRSDARSPLASPLGRRLANAIRFFQRKFFFNQVQVAKVLRSLLVPTSTLPTLNAKFYLAT
ncbi:MAG: hypothetical protein V7L00_31350 [Nostoc sp.]|uniref:hypothetical protein n=1 Tax=Nostoc sp. TaxID=1180 RepID=UPI002FFA7195